MFMLIITNARTPVMILGKLVSFEPINEGKQYTTSFKLHKI
jgi:hypothetical protein